MKSIAQVDHAFGNHVIFHNATIDLPDRGVVALRGANGAGKTTLLKLLGGVISTSCEDIRTWRKNNTAVYLDMDYLTLDYLRAGEVLDMVRPLTGDLASDELLTPALTDAKISDLSLGQRQRLILTIALSLGGVDVVLLDEPLNGLDHEAAATARKAILATGQTKLVIAATHEDEHWTDYDLVIGHDQAVRLAETEACK